ncbi:MAG: DNA polymerase III subunit [Prevotellaceae bacterium]|jgi:DNA polymerase-3 subunit delta'|nr:DNA polymerase III subunit [Prevotellaceae bacterium]
MFFSETIGQNEVKRRFVQSVQERRIPHAQLICGAEGIGKLPLAIAYAQYICCENRGENDSCGVCPSCVKFAKLAHPDLHFVFPVIKPAGKTTVVCDDFLTDFRNYVLQNPYFSVNSWFDKIGGSGKQGMIYSNESEEIIRKLNLKTYESEYKVMIIWQPEKMHNSCANKLLKILEEPPEKTVFLLVSDAPDEIIITILSRTQRINVPPIELNYIANQLVEHYEMPLADASYIARLANGSYLHAMQIAEQNEANKQHFDSFVLLMRTAWGIRNFNDLDKKGDALINLRKFAETMAKIGRENQKAFLAYAQRMVRENFIYNFRTAELNYQAPPEQDFSSKFSPFINEGNVIGMMNELALAERHIEQNVQAKIVFYDLALKIIMLLKK